jgi:hypothetical protein
MIVPPTHQPPKSVRRFSLEQRDGGLVRFTLQFIRDRSKQT